MVEQNFNHSLQQGSNQHEKPHNQGCGYSSLSALPAVNAVLTYLALCALLSCLTGFQQDSPNVS